MTANEQRAGAAADQPLTDPRAEQVRHTQIDNGDGSTATGPKDDGMPESPAPDPAFVAMLERFRDATPADQVFAAGTQSAAPATEDLKCIGRFQIIRQLGQGGYGVVFLARDPDLNRLVALKVPRPEVLVTASLRRRFLREGMAAAALNHAGVVPVFEAGHAGPICYIASAYCQGPNLQEWMESRGYDVEPRCAARWVQQLADAIQHAHSRGVLHRDLKPSNVLMVSGGDEPDREDERVASTPCVTDFGLARIVDAPIGQTGSGAVLGTPSYMAPEQAAGNARLTGPATDVYGLGAILYFLLTGRPPLAAATPVATLQAVVSDEPVRPTRHSPRVPRDLEAICLHCLEKEPARRYASASELSADLQRFLDDEPVRARHITNWERASRWCRKNRALAALAAALLATLLVASVAMSVLWWKAESKSQLAERQAGQLEAKQAQLEQAIDRLFTAIAESPEIRSAGAEPLRRRLLEEAQQYYQQFVVQQPTDDALRYEHAKTLFRLARVHDVLGDLQSAIALAQEAVDELEQARGTAEQTEADRDLWRTFLASRWFRAGKFDEARELYRQVLSTVSDPTSMPRDERRRLAMAWSDLAASEIYAADTGRAKQAAERAFRLWESVNNEPTVHLDPLELTAYARCLRTLGQLREMTGDIPGSQTHYQQAVDLLEPHLALDSVDAIDLRAMYAGCQQGLGIALAQQDLYEQARQHYRTSLATYQQLVDEHPSVCKYREDMAGVWYSFAVTQLLTEQYAESVRMVRNSINEMLELAELLPDKRLTMLDRCGKDHNLLYVALSRQEKYDEAREAIETALELFDTVLQERPDWLETRIAQAETTGNYGNLLSNLGDYGAALEKYRAARRLIEPIHQQQPDHRRALGTLISSYTGPVSLYTKTEQYQLALDELRNALRIAGDARTPHDQLHEVWLLDRLQRYEEAAQLLGDLENEFAGSAASLAALVAKSQQLLDYHTERRQPDVPSEHYVAPTEHYLQQLGRLARSREDSSASRDGP